MLSGASALVVRIPFWKVESVGNDFVLVHLDDIELLAGATDINQFLEQLAVQASERRFGIGSDGLLVLKRLGGGSEVVSAEELGMSFGGHPMNREPSFRRIHPSLEVRMFNPDGTEDFCGNGLRCAVIHAQAQGWVGTDPNFSMLHLGRQVPVVFLPNGQFACVLPPADYEPAAVPHLAGRELFDTDLFMIDGRSYRGSVLSTGTAHTVLWVDELPEDEEFLRVSPKIEHHHLFPERTSVMWVRESSRDHLQLRIWERGAGETMACGTGSMAASADYLRRAGKSGSVHVQNPGGTLVVNTGRGQHMHVTGPAEELFQGEFLFGKSRA